MTTLIEDTNYTFSYGTTWFASFCRPHCRTKAVLWSVRVPLTPQDRTAYTLQAGLTTTNGNRNRYLFLDANKLHLYSLCYLGSRKDNCQRKLQKPYFHQKNTRNPACLKRSALVTLAKVTGGFPSKRAWAFQMAAPQQTAASALTHVYVPRLEPSRRLNLESMLALTTSPGP